MPVTSSRMLLTDLFAASVAAHADLPAIDAPPGRDRPTRVVTSYRELARLAAGVAGALAPHVGDESLVVVLLPRSGASLYAATIGVLQAGAAYVGVDPAFPDAHLGHVVRDGRVAAIVTDAAGAVRARGFGVPVVMVTAADGAAATWSLPPPSRPRGDRSLAYAIYTSGTTGAPKGVLVEHRGVVNLVRSGVERFGIGPTDRIAQGSSPAYDSSVEETWLAFAAGACVVVLDDDAVRLGPDLAAWLRRERVTVFCPPPTLLRAMDVASPRAELPDLRLCYVGGEALPQDLADRWGGELWLENGYGPTECSVTVVRGRVRPGAPVTIGTVVLPNVAHVLDDELRPVAGDAIGELCIGGPSLARGYLGQPALTAQRFPELPALGRVYRTGDLVQRLPGGELRCLGRIDAQVKVRGHRIELEAVEAVLARCPGVREVACAVQDEGGENVLVAHVVATPGGGPDDAALAVAVRAALPEPMVPARFGRLPILPRTIGGKVHRPALPRLAPPVASTSSAWQPTTAAEREVRAAFAAALRIDPAAIAADSDFFALGGDSLRAALLVSSLRRGGVVRVAVRDVYERRTPAALVAAAADHAAASATSTGSAASPRPLPPVPWGALAVQMTFLVVVLAGASALAAFAAFGLLPWLAGELSLTAMLLLLPWFAAAGLGCWTLVASWIAVTAKEVLIGRYVPTRVPAWSSLHVRHWLVVRLVRLVPWSLLAGTEAQHVVLRALGARIGRRVHIHRGVDLLGGGWDLLELGDDVTLQREAELVTCELEDGAFVVGAVRIDDGATLQTRAGVGPGVHVGRGAVIGALSFVPSGSVVPPGERHDGVPAVRTGAAMAAPAVDVAGRELAPWAYTVLLLGVRLAWAPLAALPLTGACWLAATAVGVDAPSLVAWLCGDGPWSRPAWVFAAVALAVAVVPLSLLAQALALRTMPVLPNGTHARWSWLHLRLQVRTELVESAGAWLSGTLFWPAWLALAGMRVGRGCEISTILDALPEAVRIGDGSFLADGVYLGVPAQHQGAVTVAVAELGARTFVGNHAVIAGGQRLPDDLVLGVSTVADDGRMRGGGGWFGQPAFALPNREVVVVDRRLTHDPGLLRYANRWLWEASRVLLPALPVALGLWWCDHVAAAEAYGVAASVARAIVATAVCVGVLVFVVWALKWLLLGRVRPGQHGLWSCWASRWDFHYVVWQRYGRPFLQPLEGTLLLPWFLRAMGMRIGRRCVLGDGFAHVVDPDMIAIGDGATVHALFQAHSFEDRVLKIDRVRIGAGATVGRGTVVLYGADIGERSHVLPHGVVMKHELLLPHRTYAGVPTIERTTAEPSVVPAAAPTPVGPAGRETAFDVARGCAVLGMFWLHLVPEPDGGVIAWSLWALEGVPAALFFVLAGVAWASAGTRTGDDGYRLPWPFVLRRSLALAVAGVLFWRWLWPNDVLAPFALALPCCVLVLRGGRLAIAGAIAALLAAVPLATAALGTWVENDLLEDGTHLANHAFGWCTLRWYLFDGAYPLLPWLALPLFGAAVALGSPTDAARALRWMWLGLAAQAMAICVDALTVLGGDEFELLAPYTAVTWQPTSLPFVLSNGGLALLVIGALRWRAARRGLPNWTAPFAALGRLSLTHYVGHVALVYTPLRLVWPEEDWPLAVGIAAAAGYAVGAVVVSAWWVRSGRRGPLEALLRFASGPGRSA